MCSLFDKKNRILRETAFVFEYDKSNFIYFVMKPCLQMFGYRKMIFTFYAGRACLYRQPYINCTCILKFHWVFRLNKKVPQLKVKLNFEFSIDENYTCSPKTWFDVSGSTKLHNAFWNLVMEMSWWRCKSQTLLRIPSAGLTGRDLKIGPL